MKRGNSRNVTFIYVPLGKSESDLKAGWKSDRVFQRARRPDPGTVTNAIDGKWQGTAVLYFEAGHGRVAICSKIGHKKTLVLVSNYLDGSDVFVPPAPDWGSIDRLTPIRRSTQMPAMDEMESAREL